MGVALTRSSDVDSAINKGLGVVNAINVTL